MDIQINKLKLTDSPYSTQKKQAFLFEDNEVLEQIVLELRHANPSSFLISGYRGVGKTSFINRITEKLSDDFVCAHINVAKYDGYPRVVKKLIRQLYLEYEIFITEKKMDLSDLTEEFKLLYDRTFHDIVNSHINNSKKEAKTSTDAEFDVKKILPIICLIVSVTILYFDVVSSKTMGYLAFFVSLLWACLTSWKLTFSKSKTNSDTFDLSRKSLYDDEIAEHHLLAIMQKLQQKNIQVLISFDEIDKIQNVLEVTKVIDDLKSLLLSGYANFFVIAGQGLYYEYEKSVFRENEVIATLFSKVIHVPFIKYTTIKKFCLELLDDSVDKTNAILNNFFDLMILGSGRIPRKLVNIIRSNLTWSGDQAYLSIDESLEAMLKKEAKLLNCLTGVMDNDLPAITRNDVQRDFFIAQVHLWIAKMREYSSGNFLMSVIIDESAYKDKYPDNYIAQLYPLSELLTDRLLEQDILKIRHGDDPEIESSYYWNNEVPATITSPDLGNENDEAEDIPDIPTSPILPNSSGDFITEFAHLEALLRKLYLEVQPLGGSNNTALTFNSLLEGLMGLGVLTRKWHSSSKIKEIVETRNKIVHGLAIGEEELKALRSSVFNLNRLKAEIMEDYAYFVTKEFLSGYAVVKENAGGFDFLATKGVQTIAFDVKYRETGRATISEIKGLIDRFSNYLAITDRKATYIIFCFQPENKMDDPFFNRINKILESEYQLLKDWVEVIYIPEGTNFGFKQFITISLKEIIGELPDSDQESSKFHDTKELAEAENIIKTESEKQWPDDFNMQLDTVDRETAALNKLKALLPIELSEAQFEKIARKAKDEWPTSYVMQLDTFNRQSEALNKLNALKAPPISEEEFNQIISKAKAEWPTDYTMQLHEFEKQKQALLVIQDLKAGTISEVSFQQIKNRAKSEWPNDYDMQLHTIRTQVDSLNRLGGK